MIIIVDASICYSIASLIKEYGMHGYAKFISIYRRFLNLVVEISNPGRSLA